MPFQCAFTPTVTWWTKSNKKACSEPMSLCLLVPDEKQMDDDDGSVQPTSFSEPTEMETFSESGAEL